MNPAWGASCAPFHSSQKPLKVPPSSRGFSRAPELWGTNALTCTSGDDKPVDEKRVAPTLHGMKSETC